MVRRSEASKRDKENKSAERRSHITKDTNTISNQTNDKNNSKSKNIEDSVSSESQKKETTDNHTDFSNEDNSDIISNLINKLDSIILKIIEFVGDENFNKSESEKLIKKAKKSLTDLELYLEKEGITNDELFSNEVQNFKNAILIGEKQLSLLQSEPSTPRELHLIDIQEEQQHIEVPKHETSTDEENLDLLEKFEFTIQKIENFDHEDYPIFFTNTSFFKQENLSQINEAIVVQVENENIALILTFQHTKNLIGGKKRRKKTQILSEPILKKINELQLDNARILILIEYLDLDTPTLKKIIQQIPTTDPIIIISEEETTPLIENLKVKKRLTVEQCDCHVILIESDSLGAFSNDIDVN